MFVGLGTTVFGFMMKLATGGMADKVIGFLEKKQDAQTEEGKQRTQVTIEMIKGNLEDRKIEADLTKSKMSYMPFWILLSIAMAPMLNKWIMINLYDVYWCAGCMFPQDWTIAAYQPPFDRWAETAFTWIFGPLAGGAGVGAGIAAFRRGR